MIAYHAGLTMLIVWFVMRGNPRVDYRIVAVAALLPDIVDKSIGRVLFKSTFESGRLFGHTLTLNVALFCVAFFLRGRHKRTYTLIPIASLLHLALDGMWSTPEVFWWPAFGTAFPADPIAGGALAFLNPFNEPVHLLQEVAGLAAIAWLLAAHGILNAEGVRGFIRTGMLTAPREADR